MPVKFVTHEVYQQRVHAMHGDSVKILTKFQGWETKIQCMCTMCGDVKFCKPQNLTSGRRCRLCAREQINKNIAEAKLNSASKIIRLEAELEAAMRINKVIRTGNELIINNYSRLGLKCLVCAYEWISSFRMARAKSGCPECAEKRRIETTIRIRTLSHDEFTSRLKYITNGASILLTEWKGESYERLFRATCGHSWRVPAKQQWYIKLNCPVCTPRRSRCYSKVSIRWLEKEAKSRSCYIQHAYNGDEFRIPGTRIKVDGYCKETNTIFEFHGDVYHGNPKLYKPTDYPHPFKPSITAHELYTRTLEREKVIKNLGFNLVTMWEFDYYTRNLRAKADS